MVCLSATNSSPLPRSKNPRVGQQQLLLFHLHAGHVELRLLRGRAPVILPWGPVSYPPPYSMLMSLMYLGCFSTRSAQRCSALQKCSSTANDEEVDVLRRARAGERPEPGRSATPAPNHSRGVHGGIMGRVAVHVYPRGQLRRRGPRRPARLGDRLLPGMCARGPPPLGLRARRPPPPRPAALGPPPSRPAARGPPPRRPARGSASTGGCRLLHTD